MERKTAKEKGDRVRDKETISIHLRMAQRKAAEEAAGKRKREIEKVKTTENVRMVKKEIHRS